MGAKHGPIQESRSARAHFGIGAVIILASTVLSLWLHDNSILRDLQILNLDLLFLSQTSPSEMDRVAVVAITGEDYRDLFKSQSPLSLGKIQELILASAKSGARVVGVDLDTSSWSSDDRRKLQKDLERMVVTPPPIVWAVGAWETTKVAEQTPKVQGKEGHKKFLMSQSLQGLLVHDCDALPASIPDRFGFVHGYLRAVKLEQNSQPVVKAGMAALISGKMDDRNYPCNHRDLEKDAADLTEFEAKELLVNFASPRSAPAHISAGDLLRVYKSEAWGNFNSLKDRAVLIGGSFVEARDKYPTFAGYMDGVDILARSVMSEKNRITQASHNSSLAVDLALGVSLLLATWYLSRLWAVVLAFVLVPLLTVVTSFVLFKVAGIFASAVPVIVGVYLHHLLEHVWEHAQLKKEIRHLMGKIESLEAKLTSSS